MVSTLSAGEPHSSSASGGKFLIQDNRQATFHDGQVRAELQVKGGGFAIGSLAATHAGRVEDNYELDPKKVGEGGFGVVRRGRCKATGGWRAVKSIARSAVPEPELLREEIDIMRILDHPHIVRLSETYEDGCWVYIVMDLCEGGELFQQITEAYSFSEAAAASCTRQMLLAVNYLHQNRIMHRDLKPENFLLAEKAPIENCTLKLIDFGFAKRVALGQKSHTLCGTLLYIAPEVLEEEPSPGCGYDFKADVWSLGIIIYLMLSGRFPWGNVRGDDQLVKLVKAGKITTLSGNWRSISNGAKNLVHHLLTKEAPTRPAAVHALQHEWLAVDRKHETTALALSTCNVKNLKAFGQMNAMKKAAADVLVTQLPESEIVQLRKVFIEMDTNRDGTVSFPELKRGLEQTGAKLPKNMLELMNACDLDGSGVLDYTEFLAATVDRKQYHQKDIVWAAFRRFDVDGSGFIDKTEMAKLLNDEVKEAMHLKSSDQMDLQKMFSEVDTDNNNRIDFDEFFQMMRSMNEPAATTSSCGRTRKLKVGGRTPAVMMSSMGEE